LSLIIAFRNNESVVAASDSRTQGSDAPVFGQFMNVPGRAVLLIAGNLAAVKAPIVDLVLPKLNASTSAAALAQYLQAALVIEVVPHLADLPGRVELIVAGIDPVRHTEEPGLYYLDSAADFYLKPISGNYIAAGATAAISEVLKGRDLQAASTDELITIAKDCMTTTKLHWPQAVDQYLQFGVITPKQIRIMNY
jgi:hypothetical protein